MDLDDPIESSPPPTLPYVTQPTQPIDPPQRRISDVIIPASSPDNRLSNNNMSAQQRTVFNRMAPPGTFLNVVAAPPPFSSQSQRVPIQLDSDSEDGDAISNSEDDLNREQEDPSNIPPAKIAKTAPKTGFGGSFSHWRYNPGESQNSFTSTSTSQGSTIGSYRIADVFLDQKAKRIQEVLPHISRERILESLKRHRGHEQDAMDALVVEEDDEDKPIRSNKSSASLSTVNNTKGIAKTQKPLLPKPTMKRTLDGHKTMKEKYHRARDIDELQTSGDELSAPLDEDSRKSKKRKLVRGLKSSSVQPLEPEIKQLSKPVPTLAGSLAKTKKKQRRRLDSDGSAIDSDMGSGSEAASSTDEEVVAGRVVELLNFFNESTAAQLADLASIPESEATLLLTHRPFKSLNQVRAVTDSNQQPSKGRKKKRTLGERILDVSEQMFAGFSAVDRILQDCRRMNVIVRKGMEKLRLSTNGTEIEATDFTQDGKVDSGIPTPESSGGAPSNSIGTPSIMSKDITLKDYQIVALNWMNLLWSNGISAILADDMGLGKTCQVIAFLSHLYTLGKTGVHLIIVPSSTLENWVREFQRFSPKMELLVYHGTEQERAELRYDFEKSKQEINVVVTTYEMARRKRDRQFLRKTVQPMTVVFDEGHMLKNKESERYKAMMEVSRSCWRLLLTGTPLQNNLRELVSILGFIMPDVFEENERDLDQIFKHRAKTYDTDASALLSARRIARVREMMAPFILRRKKDQVLKHLPTKTCTVEFCDMTEEQKELYDDQARLYKEDTEARAAGEYVDSKNYLMEQRKAALHPLLFRQKYTDEIISKFYRHIPRKGKFRGWSDIKMEEELWFMSDFQIHTICTETEGLEKYALKGDPWMESGKVQKLIEILRKNIANGDKTLVFSQFTSVLDILEPALECSDISFCRMDGSTPVAMRQEYIDEFYNDDTIGCFMLSTKAGGTGINLVCANKVVIFDSSFNPQDDVQAENRAHRVGQTREVEVVRLVSKGTVEEAIWALGKNKLALDRMVHSSGEDAESLGEKLVEKMLLEGNMEVSLSSVEDPASKMGSRSVSSSSHGSASSAVSNVNSASATDESGAATPIDGKTKGSVDVKDAFLQGLKNAGLNVSA